MSFASARSEVPAAPCVLIRARERWWSLDLPELWRQRDVIAFLALRDVKVRYKQSVLGAAWAVIQPLLTMVVFTALFTALMGPRSLPTLEGVPYAVSIYCALVPWQLFSTAVRTSGNSLVANQHLITKVYFPRLAAPIAPILAALLDFVLALAVLLVMLVFAGSAPSIAALALPAFTLLAVASALAVSLWLSAVNAIYRDVQHALPFLVQLWMFATPVVYTSDHVREAMPVWALTLYELNPMAHVVEGFRWALLGAPPPDAGWLLASSGIVVVMLVAGTVFFRRLERVFADLV